jgi:hypothetical protein
MQEGMLKPDIFRGEQYFRILGSRSERWREMNWERLSPHYLTTVIPLAIFVKILRKHQSSLRTLKTLSFLPLKK